MKNLKIFLTVTIALSCSLNGVTQDQKIIDSLNLELRKYKERKIELGIKKASLYDTTQIKILAECAMVYLNIPDKAMNYATQILALSKQIRYKKGIGKGYNFIGYITYRKGEYKIALKYFKKAEKIFIEIGHKTGLAKVYLNMGDCCPNDQSVALDYRLKALKIYEEANDQKGIGVACSGISYTYLNSGNFKQFYKYAFKSLKIAETLGDKTSMARIYGNIGISYRNEGKGAKGMHYLIKSSESLKEIGDLNGLIVGYLNIADSYEALKNYDEALKYQSESLKLAEQLDDKALIAANLLGFGSIYTKQKKYKLAKESLDRSLYISKEIGMLQFISWYYMYTQRLNTAQGEHEESLKNYMLFIQYRDSISNAGNTQKITELQNKYDSEKKEALQIEIQKNKDELAKADKKRQFLMTILFASAAFAITIIAFVVIIALRKTRKQKRIIEKQKAWVEEKQKEVMDSIRYAKRIQFALLPSEKSIIKGLSRLNK